MNSTIDKPQKNAQQLPLMYIKPQLDQEIHRIEFNKKTAQTSLYALKVACSTDTRFPGAFGINKLGLVVENYVPASFQHE